MGSAKVACRFDCKHPRDNIREAFHHALAGRKREMQSWVDGLRKRIPPGCLVLKNGAPETRAGTRLHMESEWKPFPDSLLRSIACLFATFSGCEVFFCQPLVLVGAEGTIPLNASCRLLRDPIPPLEMFGRFGSETGDVEFLKSFRRVDQASCLLGSGRRPGCLPLFPIIRCHSYRSVS
jgi:hypothetical protein